MDFGGNLKLRNPFLDRVAGTCYGTKRGENKIERSLLIPLTVNDRLYNLSENDRPYNLTSCLNEYISTPPSGKYSIYICTPSSLRTLLLPDASIQSIENQKLYHTYFDTRSLNKYSARGNQRTTLLQKVFSSKTTYLDFSDNFISFVEKDYFNRANLSHLNLSGNFL